MIPLKFRARIIAGQSPPSDEVTDLTTGLPFVQGTAEFGARTPLPRLQCASPPKRAKAGDVLVSVRAPVGAVNVASDELGIGRGVAAVRPAGVDPRYLAWWMLSQATELNSLATGTTFSAVTAGTLGRLVLDCDFVSTQCAIADYLDRKTARIAEQEALVSASIERRQAQIEGASLWTGRAPDVRLSHIAIKLNRPTISDAGVVTAFRDGQVTLRDLRRAEGYTESADGAGYQGVRKGDLVFHGLDGFAGAVGVAEADGVCSPVYHVFKASGPVNPAFLANALRAMGTSGQLGVLAGNVRQRSVDFRSWSTFGAIPVALPSPLQQESSVVHAEAARQGDVLLDECRKLIALLKERRSALITAAVTGKFDVRGS